jgi:hypothetical protein
MKSWFFVAAVAFLATLSVTAFSASGGDAEHLTVLSLTKVKEILQKQGFSSGWIVSVTRNSTGTRLFIVYHAPTNADWQTIVTKVTANDIQVDQVQAATAYFDDDGQVVCESKDNALVFRSGKRIALTPYSHWGFAPGGRIFYLDQDGNGAALFKTTEPDKPLVNLDPTFIPEDIFERDDGKIYVFGQTSHRVDPKAGARGYLISHSGDEFRIDNNIDLSWMGGVVDMSGTADRVLLESKSDLFPTWTIYDLNSKKSTRKGRVNGYGVFLDKALHDRFK